MRERDAVDVVDDDDLHRVCKRGGRWSFIENVE